MTSILMDKPTLVMTPTEDLLFFVDSHEAWKYWVGRPDRDRWAMISLTPDMESGGWIIPRA